jgi:hypothetical protein
MEKQQGEFYILFAHRINWWAFVTNIFEVVEKTDFSHCCVYYNGFIYEAEFPASRKIDYSKWKKPYEEKLCYHMPVSDKPSAVLFLESLTGKPYSITQLILIGLRKLFPNRQFLKTISLNKLKSLDCTEFVALFQIAFCGAKYDVSMDAVDLNEVRSLCEKIKIE